MTEDEAKTLIQLLDKLDSNVLDKVTSNLAIEIIEKLGQSLSNSKCILHEQNIKNALEFILWNDVWNSYGIYGDKKDCYRNKSASSLFGKGRFLYLDFGQHNIGAEFSFSHMGIVLKDFENLIVVVPVTSDRGQTYSNEIEQSIIRVKKKEYKQFNEDSILLIHQIQSLGKNRINRYLGQTINNTPLMAEIEENIFKTFAPYIFGNRTKDIARLERIIENKEERIKYLEKIIQEQKLPEPPNISGIDGN